jgi:SprT protein
VIDPIGEPQQQEVRDATEHYIAEAERIFSRGFERIPVLFDLKGQSAGMFKRDGVKRCIRYNPWIFAKYYAENLHETVPHEVAHFIVDEVYDRRRTRAHGEEWRLLMHAFGVVPQVTFKQDLEGIPRRRQKTHAYRCDCRLHEVSSTRHNRVQKGKARYHCLNCEGELIREAAAV